MDERNACLTNLNNYIPINFNTNFTKNSNPSDYDVSLTLSDPTSPPAPLITDTINGTQFDTVCNQLATDIDSNTGVPSHLYIVDPQNNRTEAAADTSSISYTQITSGTIGGYRTMLNDEGDFDGTGVRGIGYYQNVLDTLANQFASIMNQQNSTEDSNKPLFASSDPNNATVNASNIAISREWADSVSGWLTTTKTNSTTGTNSPSSDGLNLISMVSALSQNINFTTASGNAPTGKALFSASINTFMSTVTNTVLAPQLNNVTREKDVADSELANTDSERASVSSVDINEEGINMIRYNQAFSASSRFMSAINDMLDTLINKMGIS
jgi:flagellar hook-associated protein 1 FlgK